jgi:AbrB family looped-hinge helix DNA binding protein
MPTAKLTSKGQLTVPRDVREDLGLRAGDSIDFIKDDGGFRIRKRTPPDPFKKWRGYFKDLAGKDPDELVEEWRGR